MAELQVAVVVAHTQRDQVFDIKLKVRRQAERNDVMDLKQLGPAAGGACWMLREVRVTNGVPTGGTIARFIALTMNGSDLRDA
jgi:hypothetical protein